MTTETTFTTKLMPYLDCLRWMHDQGYRILMWPAIRMEGHGLCTTRFEPLHETIDDYVAGLRRQVVPLCFVVQAESMSGDQNAYVYVLPEDLDTSDQAETALVIENLRDCEQFMCDDEKDSNWWVYKCAGVRRAPPWP